jgi:hypothetical protein
MSPGLILYVRRPSTKLTAVCTSPRYSILDILVIPCEVLFLAPRLTKVLPFAAGALRARPAGRRFRSCFLGCLLLDLLFLGALSRVRA